MNYTMKFVVYLDKKLSNEEMNETFITFGNEEVYFFLRD